MFEKSPHICFQSYANECHVHEHEFHQIVLPISGALDLRVAHTEDVVSASQIAIIAAGSEHAFSASPVNRFVVANIPYAMFPHMEKLPAFANVDASLQQYLCFVQQYLKGGGRCHQAIVELLVALLQEKFESSTKQDKRLNAVKQFIDTHYLEPLCIPQLAQVGHLSVRQLNTLFRELFGQSPKQYLIAKRMTKAKQLLLHSNDNVSQIAQQVGYSSLATFSERFKQYNHCSPKEFRRNSQT